MNNNKQCSICNEVKEFEEFYSQNKKKSNGTEYVYYQPYCKKCSIEKTSKNRDLERANELNKHYYRTREATRDARRRVSRKRYQNGKYKAWLNSDPERRRQYGYNHMNKKHNISDEEWINCKEYFNNCCAYCEIPENEAKEKYGHRLHMEHAINDGANDLSNCIPSCRLCNTHKWARDYTDWYFEDNENFTIQRLDKIIKWLNEDYKLHKNYNE